MNVMTKQKLDLIFLMEAEKKSLIVQSSVGLIADPNKKLRDFFDNLPNDMIENAGIRKNLIGFEKAEALFGFGKYIDILKTLEEFELLGKTDNELFERCERFNKSEENYENKISEQIREELEYLPESEEKEEAIGLAIQMVEDESYTIAEAAAEVSIELKTKYLMSLVTGLKINGVDITEISKDTPFNSIVDENDATFQIFTKDGNITIDWGSSECEIDIYPEDGVNKELVKNFKYEGDHLFYIDDIYTHLQEQKNNTITVASEADRYDPKCETLKNLTSPNKIFETMQ